MRIFLGIILGFILTVGVVYVIDHTTPEAAPNTPPTRMVNWDVVSEKLGTVGVKAHDLWNRLTGAPAEAPKVDAPKP
jgi:hypothetical protein